MTGMQGSFGHIPVGGWSASLSHELTLLTVPCLSYTRVQQQSPGSSLGP